MVSTDEHGGDRREAILAAAEQLFERFGLNKTSMDEVARLAGVSKPIIYRHFENKSALFVAFLERKTQQFFHEAEAATRDIAGHADKLRAALQFHLDRFRAMELRDEVTRELVLALGRHLYEHREERQDRRLPLANLIRDGIAAGEFREVDPLMVAQGIDSALRGVALESGVSGNVEQAFRNVEQMMDIIVRGLMA
jgi:AcrR family transcriptional regulator